MSAKKKKAARPSKLGSKLRVSDGFRAFVLDQLGQIREVTPRSMFGGVGLYHQDLFFGILAGDTLYLKADDQTREQFERAGGHPFEPYPDRGGSMRYYSVPLAILEDIDELSRWVAAAVAVAASGPPKGRPVRTSGPTVPARGRARGR